MSDTVSCACGLKYKVREDNRGKSFRCQRCGARIAVPEAEAAADDERGDFAKADFESPGDDSAKARGERPAVEKQPGSKRAAKGKSSGPRSSGSRTKPGLKAANSSAGPLRNKKLLIIGAVGLAGLFATGLVLLLMFAGGGGKPDGNAKVDERQEHQKLAPVQEDYTIYVADATPAQGLSALSLVASAKPAQNWSVKLGEIKPPEKLGSVWHAPIEAPPEELWTPSLLTTGGTRAALLYMPNVVKPLKLFEIDLTKPGAATKGIDLPPPEGSAPPRHIALTPSQIWAVPGQPGKFRPRDRWQRVAAINPTLTRVANGIYSNSRMQVWDGTGKRLASIDAPDRSHWVFAEFPTDDLLCLIAADGTARLVEPANGRVVQEGASVWRGSPATTPDRKYVVGCSESTVEFRDSSTLKLAGSLPLPDDLAKAAKVVGPSLDVSADGQRLAAFFVVDESFVLLAWDLATQKLTDAYMRKAYGADLWVQWVGKRRLVIAGDSQIDFSVLDLDRRAIIYTTGRFVITAPSVDGRVWRFSDRHKSDWLNQIHQKVRGESGSRELPPLLLAGAAVPDRIEKSLPNLKGLPVNRNLAVRVEVAGREHWPLKETASGFAEYLSKNGFTVDPNATIVYRLVLDYKSVSINRSGMVGPSVGGDPGVAFRANLDLGTNSTEATIYLGFETFPGKSALAPKGLTVDEWESGYPAATKAARDNFLKSIRAVVENRTAGLRGVGTSSDHESYYLAEGSGDYSVPRPFEGDFPVDGYHQP